MILGAMFAYRTIETQPSLRQELTKIRPFEIKRSIVESFCWDHIGNIDYLFETERDSENSGEELVDLLQFFAPACFTFVHHQSDPAPPLQQSNQPSEDAIAHALFELYKTQKHSAPEPSRDALDFRTLPFM